MCIRDSIGAAPALFLGLLRSPLMFVKVLIVQVVAQQLESNLITPQILGRQLGLHPLSVSYTHLDVYKRQHVGYTLRID